MKFVHRNWITTNVTATFYFVPTRTHTLKLCDNDPGWDHPSNFKWHNAQEWHQWRTSLTGHTLSKRKNCRRVYSAELLKIVCRLSVSFYFFFLFFFWQSYQSAFDWPQTSSPCPHDSFETAEFPNIQLSTATPKPQKNEPS